MGDRPILVGYTSGSTGSPTGHAKRWPSLQACTALNAARIRAAIPAALAGRTPWVVGTVPPQHMYGMETTVLLPLLSGMGLHAGRPLLPAEVADALGDVPEPRVLVSTPAHLRAIVHAGIALPPTAVVVSATAPLDRALAAAVETITGGTLVEMFGSTETCIVGHRETARETAWQSYPGVRFTPDGDGTRVDAPWFAHAQRLMDVIEPGPGSAFSLQGRSADLIDVAGKRGSLADITRRLLAVEGVVDAVVFQPSSAEGLVSRLAAFVVAPGVEPATLRAALEHSVDPVFVPRPLLLVDALPRNATGKLPRHLLDDLLATHERPRERRD